MTSKWSTKAEVKVLVALLHVLHDGAPMLDRDTCKQLKAEMSDEDFTEGAIRQHLQAMFRKYESDKGSTAAPVSSPITPTKTLATTGSKRHATSSVDELQAGKRGKTGLTGQSYSDRKKKETGKVAEEVKAVKANLAKQFHSDNKKKETVKKSKINDEEDEV
ncbi:MAG: hypothetical protein LQ346_008310 [Caloplaca aetnensis]|nr:MAG: hypothetical protein LQ346_008310 [Caloplaca aetnensis]